MSDAHHLSTHKSTYFEDETNFSTDRFIGLGWIHGYGPEHDH